MSGVEERILYEDNHLIILNKESSEIVQGDKTGDPSLGDAVKEYIRIRDKKPGNVFLGLSHRLDRPTSGLVVFAKTSKALSRMNALFRDKAVSKIYWAALEQAPPEPEGQFCDFLRRDRKKNRSFVCKAGAKDAKKGVLSYKVLCRSSHYVLVQIELETGRHHQIRAQFAARGCCIKGDLKYGARRSNPGGGIHLHARQIFFIHPVSQKEILVTAPLPAKDNLWQDLARLAQAAASPKPSFKNRKNPEK